MMQHYQTQPEFFSIRREADTVVVENCYVQWKFDLKHGGELCSAVVKNGSGQNLLAWPQQTTVSIVERRFYHEYSSLRVPAANVRITSGNIPELRFSQQLADKDQNILKGLVLERRILFSPWGYSVNKVDFHASRPVENIGQVQIGSFGAAERFDCAAIRAPWAATSNIVGTNPAFYKEMFHGMKAQDVGVYLNRLLPVSVLLFQRGVEGIEFALGDNLAEWDRLAAEFSGRQQCYICYSTGRRGYETRFCTLDTIQTGHRIAGDYHLSFRMALPYVKAGLVPLRPYCGGAMLGARGFENRWPREADLAEWQRRGIDLVRWHNDGDYFDNGQFWHDGEFPPYEPAELEKMKLFLKQAKQHGISVVPYFSGKELHPRVDSFAAHGKEWARSWERDKLEILYNYSHDDYFGAQMCLESGWLDERKKCIDRTLSAYDFNGVYYDWCGGAECQNPAHGSGRHWDNDRLQNLLEWSRTRVGSTGEVYLHLTDVPNLAAENLATLVLTEEKGYGLIGPEMFTPHVHFMNIAPRQICNMLPRSASPEDQRRLVICALLHHATISDCTRDHSDIYQLPALQNLSRFTRHSAPGEHIAEISRGAGISLYWNNGEILALAANLTDENMQAHWTADAAQLGRDGGTLSGTVELKPLEVREIRIGAPAAGR